MLAPHSSATIDSDWAVYGVAVVRGLRIVELSYNPETAIISFTASVQDTGGSTTVASYTSANTSKITRKQANRLVEQRVAQLLARQAPSGRAFRQG